MRIDTRHITSHIHRNMKNIGDRVNKNSAEKKKSTVEKSDNSEEVATRLGIEKRSREPRVE